MKRLLISLVLFLSLFHIWAQETVRIEFLPMAPEEFDVFFKNGLESLGYIAFVNYYDRSDNKYYDKLLKYEYVDHKLTLSLFDNQGNLLKRSSKNGAFLDRIESVTYMFLGEFMRRTVIVKDKRGKIRGVAGHGLDLFKLDSSVFVIRVIGKDSATVLQDFLQTADQLLNKYEYYTEFGQYVYNYYEVKVVMQCIVQEIYGIVTGRDYLSTDENVALSFPPDLYKKFVCTYTDDIGLLDLITEKAGSGFCLLRDTGKWGDAYSMSVFIDGNHICDLNTKQYAIFMTTPGHHEVSIETSKSIYSGEYSFEIDVGPSEWIFSNLLYDMFEPLHHRLLNEGFARLYIKEFDLDRNDCVSSH